MLKKKYLTGTLSVLLLFSSWTLPIGSTANAAEATAQDISFEQAHYGSLISSGLVENPVLRTVGRGGGTTYYEYDRSIQADATIPEPNDMGKAEYYIVVEATTSVSTDYGNATTSFNRQISVSSDGSNYSQLWQPVNNGQAVVVGSPGTTTQYLVVKVNGQDPWPRETNAQGKEIEYRSLYTNMQKLRMNWSWNGPYSESMKSIKYRIYRKELPRQTDAPGIIVNPSENYHKGLNNTFSLTKPGYFANAGESAYGILQYRINNGSWNDYQDGSQVPITAEGEVKIEARLLTGGSMESLYSTAYSRQDNTPPTAPEFVGIDANKWYTNGVPIVIRSGTDTGSGSANIRYRLSGATEQPEGYLSGTPMITNEGITQIAARTVDNVGLYSDEATTPVHVDRTPPAGVLTAPQDWAKSVTITASGSDSVSGMQKITLPNGYAYRGTSKSYQVTANGTYTFSFTDVAGNSIDKSITINNIDDKLPTTFVSQDGADWTDQKVPVTFNFADAESGLDLNRLSYALTDSTEEPSAWHQAAPEQTITLEQEGFWYLHLRGYDLAGNQVDYISKAYHLQQQPKTPQLKVIGTTTDEILINWTLPEGSAETDGYMYEVENQKTGKTWNVAYPIHEVKDQSLENGEEYDYIITAKNHVGSSAASKAVIGVTLPAIPIAAGIYPDGHNYETALANITPVKSAAGYRIVATNWGTKEIDADVTVTGNTYQAISGLHPYAMYDIAVSAVNASGEGAAYHTSYLSLPDQLSGFSSVQITEDTIDLHWNTATRDTYSSWSSVTEDTYYQLDRNQTLIFEGMENQYKDTNLDPGKSYDYAVAAGNRTGFGTKSVLSNVWTLPAPVTGLHQAAADANSFTLRWKASAGTEGYRAVIDDTYIVDISGPVNQYIFDGYDPGTTHSVVLNPYNKSGYGRTVNVLGTTLPDIPVSGVLEIKNVGEDEVNFYIHEVSGADKYRLKMNGAEYIVGAGELTVRGLTGGTWYDYSFAAGNTAGFGQADTNKLLTLPSVVTGYQVVRHTPTAMDLTWKPVTGATGYAVYNSAGDLLSTTTTEKYAAADLQPGGMNRWTIRAVNKTGSGQASMFSWRTLPGFDNEDELDWNTMVKVVGTDVQSAELSWLTVPGADGYRIYDQDHQLVGSDSNPYHIVSGLASAELYHHYVITPYNSTGEGKPMPVPTFVTKPSADYIVDYTSTRSAVELQLQHKLDNEILVITAQDKELYRGSIKDYHAYSQERLQPSSSYTFVIWTENEAGERSAAVTLETRTKKERESIIKQTADTPIEVNEPTLPVEPDPVPVDASDDKKNRKSFIDINRSFAKDSITRLADLGVVKGISEDLYAPKEGTTRVEFMSMLTRLVVPADQIKAAAQEDLTFTDIQSDAWYVPELKAATKYGIAKGFSAEDFRPDQKIDREQAAKMLSGALYSLVAETDQMFYADAADVSNWAKAEVSGLTATQIVEGYPDQTFRPHANLTRAESAAMIDRALQRGMIEEPGK